MTRGLCFIVGTVLIGCVALGGTPALAQAPDVSKLKVSVIAQDKDIRDTLRVLLRDAGVTYSIAPEIQGTVNLKLENVPFLRALRSILAQQGAAYRIEGKVYQIVSQEKNVSINFTNTDIRKALNILTEQVNQSFSMSPDVRGTVTLKMDNVPFNRALQSILAQVDAGYSMEGGVCLIDLLRPSSAAKERISGTAAEKLISLKMQDVEVRTVLKELFRLAGANYAIVPEVQGSITCHFEKVDFETALESICKQVNASFHLENGVYIILPGGIILPLLN